MQHAPIDFVRPDARALISSVEFTFVGIGTRYQLGSRIAEVFTGGPDATADLHFVDASIEKMPTSLVAKGAMRFSIDVILVDTNGRHPLHATGTGYSLTNLDSASREAIDIALDDLCRQIKELPTK